MDMYSSSILHNEALTRSAGGEISINAKEERDDSFINARGSFTALKEKMVIRTLALVLLCKYPAMLTVAPCYLFITVFPLL